MQHRRGWRTRKTPLAARKPLLKRVTAVDTVCSRPSPVIAGQCEFTSSIGVSFLRGWWCIWVHSWAVEHHSRHETGVTFKRWRGKCLGGVVQGQRRYSPEIFPMVCLSLQMHWKHVWMITLFKKENPPIDINKGRSKRGRNWHLKAFFSASVSTWGTRSLLGKKGKIGGTAVLNGRSDVSVHPAGWNPAIPLLSVLAHEQAPG